MDRFYRGNSNNLPSPLIPHEAYPEGSFQKNQILTLINSILACPAARKLAEKASATEDPQTGKKGSWRIIYDPQTCAQLGSEGFSNHTMRAIVLPTLDTLKSLDVLIFEIAFASQTREYRNLQKRVRDRHIYSDDYARELERIGYTSGILHHKIVQIAMKTLRWPTNLDSFKNFVEGNFEREWHQGARFAPHAQLYRKQYADITKTAEVFPGYGERFESTIMCLIYKIQDVIQAIFQYLFPEGGNTETELDATHSLIQTNKRL